MGEHRDFKFGMQVPAYRSFMTNCPQKGRGHITWPCLNF